MYHLSSCVVSVVYTQFPSVAEGHIIKPGGPRIEDLYSTFYLYIYIYIYIYMCVCVCVCVCVSSYLCSNVYCTRLHSVNGVTAQGTSPITVLDWNLEVSTGNHVAKIRIGINFSNIRTFLFQIFPIVIGCRQLKWRKRNIHEESYDFPQVVSLQLRLRNDIN